MNKHILLVQQLNYDQLGFTLRAHSDAWANYDGLPIILPRGYRLTASVSMVGLVSVIIESIEAELATR